MKHFNHLFILGLVFILIPEVFAQPEAGQKLQEQYRLEIHRVEGKIDLDGHLNESIWQNPSVAKDFWMSFPVDGQRVAPEIQTEVRAAYDDQYMYFGAICYDSDDYVIQTLKRDNPAFWLGDAFAIVLDPVNERSSGFSFGVNPAGVQTESLIAGQTGRRGDQRPGRPPTGVNSAWDNKWFSKVQQFPDRWTVEIAIPYKSLRFESEKKIWGVNFIRGDAATNSYHTWSPVPVQFRGVDLGYVGALVWDHPPKKTKRNISLIPYALGAVFKDYEADAPNEYNGRVGMDAKIAISSSMNLDLTLNPDFSQVDVDQQVTNLTRFNIRFPERRLFFLENSDLYESFGIPPMRPFFSRRIGLDDNGNPIPILYGARLSGNLNKNFRLGLMNLQTRMTDDHAAQNYTSFAFNQRVLKRSVIKGYLHNRQAFAPNQGFDGQDFNRTAGLEFLFQSADGRLRSFAGLGYSFSPNVVRDNFFYNIAIGYDGRNISAYTNVAGVGNQYVADMGFIPRLFHYDAVADTSYRVGFHHSFSRFSYTHYPDNPKIISHQIGVRHVLDVKLNGSLIGNRVTSSYNLRWTNTAVLSADFTHEDIQLLFPFGFTDGSPLPADRYSFNYGSINYATDSRKLFSLRAGVQYGGFYNGERVEYSLGLKYRIQPWGNFELNFVQNDLSFPDPYGQKRLFLISPRIEINFSRNLFWTTFLQYNTQANNFNINSRLQWRFQPMSDLFIVYSDNYMVEFWGPKNRALVIKLNYWLNV